MATVASRIVKTMTLHALDPAGNRVYSVAVEFDRRQFNWVVYDPTTGRVISEHSQRADAANAAERECKEYLR